MIDDLAVPSPPARHSCVRCWSIYPDPADWCEACRQAAAMEMPRKMSPDEYTAAMRDAWAFYRELRATRGAS